MYIVNIVGGAMEGSIVEKKVVHLTLDRRMMIAKWLQTKQNDRQFILPISSFFRRLSNELISELQLVFGEQVEIRAMSWNQLAARMMQQVQLFSSETQAAPPIISIDPVLAPIEHADFVDRMFHVNRIVEKKKSGWKTIGHGRRYSKGLAVPDQLSAIAKLIRQLAGRKEQAITLVDGVIYSGQTLWKVEKAFTENGFKVEQIVVAYNIPPGKNAEKSFRNKIQAPIRTMGEELTLKEVSTSLDHICERDLMPGAMYAGRAAGKLNEPPLLDPQGDKDKETTVEMLFNASPNGGGVLSMLELGEPSWASIPENKQKSFTLFCLEQAIRIYEKIQQVTKQEIGGDPIIRVMDTARPPHELLGFSEMPMVDALKSVIKTVEDKY